MQSKFWEGTADPLPEFTQEYRIYYDDKGNITARVATQYAAEPPDGDYIQLERDEFYLVRPNAKVVDGEIVLPAPPSPFRLRKSDRGYGTIRNNIFFVGDEDFYELSHDS